MPPAAASFGVSIFFVVLGALVSLGPGHAAWAADGTSQPTGPEPRYEVRIDPFLAAESGARDVASAVTFLGEGEYRLDRRTAGRTLPDGSVASGRFAAGVALRAVRTFVWDLPVAWWFGVVLHEGFGHGGRAREFDASPGVHLGTPWEGRVSYASFDSRGKSTEELLYIYGGGTESNGVAATLLERRAVEGVRLRPIDLFFLASNRLVATRYVLRTTPDPRREPVAFYREYAGGGDVANYLGLLHELHGAGTGIAPAGVDDAILRDYGRFRRQAWWNAADPGLWWTLGSSFRMMARGDASPPLPLPRLGRWHFMPLFSAAWTPSGGESSLEWAMAPIARSSGPAGAGNRSGPGIGSPAWFSFIARRGDGPSGPFGALGAAGDDLRRLERLTLGGAAEIWHDPRNGAGGGARMQLRIARGALRGFYVDIGIKSQGYWVGQPASPGPFGGIGLRYER